MSDTHSIEWHTETLVLSSARYVYWARMHALLIADLHVGKSAHFRKQGYAMPGVVLQKDLARLHQSLRQRDAEKLFIIGDLFHAGTNSDLQLFSEWIQEHAHIELHLVRGNHDRGVDEFLKEHNIVIHEHDASLGPLLLSHKPRLQTGGVVAGHIHPGLLLEDISGSRLRLPAFIDTGNNLILPAFTHLSGLDTEYVQGLKNYKGYVIAGEAVVEIE